MIAFFRNLYFNSRLFYLIFGLALLFLLSYWQEWLYSITWILSMILVLLVLIDIISLFRVDAIQAKRKVPEKFSNSDLNEVIIKLKNGYKFLVNLEIIDEIPVQFQKRDFLKSIYLRSGEKEVFTYTLLPKERGEYRFGNLNVYASTFFKLVRKRYTFSYDQPVKVYPSFIQMKKLDFLALHQKTSMHGIKKIRRIGHTLEFEQIKEYVRGDDVRTINWKTTAKHNRLMVNQFQDEKSQPVYSVIDSGRVMKMPFDGLSLLDYAINSSLAFSNVALRKKDKVGLLNFSNEVHHFLKANSRLSQLNRILESLYKVNTQHYESDFGILYSRIRKHLTQRSLVMLYTNFEHMSGLKRQLPYLKAINKNHLLVVIFFENTEVTKLIKEEPETIKEAAHQTVAEQFVHDKHMMAKELQKYGIQTILTPPGELSISTINKYLEIKSRGLI
ncbi:DUF58 domain-containing protein [Christiangramia aquimixticola]|uniref:DUF58 domain-containing protein n=1 Tax=Christiangramia aquimixticola TaxID=1697558 RepID=UPI003AA90DD2